MLGKNTISTSTIISNQYIQWIYITLPDACGTGIFHGDFDSVDSDTCGDSWLTSPFMKFSYGPIFRISLN